MNFFNSYDINGNEYRYRRILEASASSNGANSDKMLNREYAKLIRLFNQWEALSDGGDGNKNRRLLIQV